MRQHAVDRPPTILIANDQEWSVRTLESILSPSGYAVLRAYSGREALERARAALPDLVLLDERMPDLCGTDVCRLLRDDPHVGPHTPIVIVTADSPSRDQALAGFAAGAWDYIQEPVDAEALLLRIGTFVLAKRAADRTREDLLDAATGLYNRRGLSRRAREIAAEASRQRTPFSCIALAAETGRAPGERSLAGDPADQLAEHLGGVLRLGSRASDAVGRLGQAEFAIVAPGTAAGGAVRLVERLQSLLDASPVPACGGPRPIRLRAGYSWVGDFTTVPPDGDELLARAASALRHVRTGRGAESLRSFATRQLRLTT